jgi:hypothetical protein
MEVYNPILSTSGKDLEKIPKNEVFMRWCLGVGKPRAHFGLGRATLASGKKKKKVARKFLKFCMEVYNLILSTSGKDLEKILTNEVFTCTFWPWPCNVGLGGKKKKLLGIFSNFAWRFITLF